MLLFACGCGPARTGGPSDEQLAPALLQYCDRRLGREDATITIQAVLPVGTGCQDGIGLYLAALAESYPGIFRVEIHDMKSQSGRTLMRSKGIRCAAVVVDGATRFDLGGDVGKVLLEGPMDPLDVHSVLSANSAGLSLSGGPLPKPDVGDAPSREQRRRAGF